jgi:hypothetical protein
MTPSKIVNHTEQNGTHHNTSALKKFRLTALSKKTFGIISVSITTQQNGIRHNISQHKISQHNINQHNISQHISQHNNTEQ